MFRDDASLLSLWNENRPGDLDFEEFLVKFENAHNDDLAELANLQGRLPSLRGDQVSLTSKAIAINQIYLNAMLKLEILGARRKRIIDEYISELIRKKLKEAGSLCFRFRPGNKIEVFFRLGSESWTVIEGAALLPCSHHMLAMSGWNTALQELECLINAPTTAERDLQRFFETYPELLAGKEHQIIIPQAVIAPDVAAYPWKADFVLSPFDQYAFATILELKLPSVQTTATKRQHPSFTARVWHSIRQVRDYADAFDSPSVRRRFQDVYNVDIFKPDLHLIIGRQWDVTQIDAIKKMKRDAQIRIETWDEVLDRLKRQYS